MNLNTIMLGMATYVGPSGATAAATYVFFTKEYKPPQQDRSIDQDVVHNQNGKFKYVYDNGPGFKKWSPFEIACENTFRAITGATALGQLNRLRTLWEHPGVLSLGAPEGNYVVHWGDSMEQTFRVFPRQVGDIIEYSVTVQFEEGQ